MQALFKLLLFPLYLLKWAVMILIQPVISLLTIIGVLARNK